MPPYSIACRKDKIVIQEGIYCTQHFNIGKIISHNVAIPCASMAFPALVLTLSLNFEIDGPTLFNASGSSSVNWHRNLMPYGLRDRRRFNIC